MNVIYTGDRADAPDIVGCVGNIISSIKGSIPYASDMGIDDSVVSSPENSIEGIYMAEVEDQISFWDERVLVDEISLSRKNARLDSEVTLKDGE